MLLGGTVPEAGVSDMVDQQKSEAYERSIQADTLLAQGRLDEARRAMAEAAALDGTYWVRAELIGRPDDRRIRVSSTVRRTLVPFLAAAGFATDEGGPWAEGRQLARSRAGARHVILLGRGKFGHRLGVGAARWRDAAQVEHYDWRAVGSRTGDLAYSTQLELEAVCARWQELIARHLLPWFDECP
jgi:hypothetical protein